MRMVGKLLKKALLSTKYPASSTILNRETSGGVRVQIEGQKVRGAYGGRRKRKKRSGVKEKSGSVSVPQPLSLTAPLQKNWEGKLIKYLGRKEGRKEGRRED